MLGRLIAGAFLAGSAAVFSVRVAQGEYAIAGATRGPFDPLELAALTAFCLTMLALGVSLARDRGRPSVTMVLVAIALGFVAATPVDAEWEACNYHSGAVPLVAYPYVMHVRPEETNVPYDGFSTLMACVPASRRAPTSRGSRAARGPGP